MLGDHYYAFVVGNNNQKTFLKYLQQLVWKLNQVEKDWRTKKLIVMDNAAIHASKEIKIFLELNNIPVLYTGVASFKAIPVELLFA